MASTCPACKLPIDSAYVQYKGKKYHPQCHEAMKAAAMAKDAKLAAKASDPDRRKLEELLLRVFDLPELPPNVTKQIEHYHKMYHYDDMFYALYYFYILEGNEPLPEASIGILSYVFNEAMEHRKRLTDAAQANAAFEPRSEDVTIKIQRPKDSFHALSYTIDEL